MVRKMVHTSFLRVRPTAPWQGGDTEGVLQTSLSATVSTITLTNTLNEKNAPNFQHRFGYSADPLYIEPNIHVNEEQAVLGICAYFTRQGNDVFNQPIMRRLSSLVTLHFEPT